VVVAPKEEESGAAVDPKEPQLRPDAGAETLPYAARAVGAGDGDVTAC